MSRIWAALPLPDPLDQWHPLGVCWWRRSLPRDDATGHQMIVRTDSCHDDQAPRMGCWEWFDGLDVQLIHGVDVFGEVFSGVGTGVLYLDVLALPETMAEAFGEDVKRWRNLTDPTSPEGARWPGHDEPHAYPIKLPPAPFPYAPRVRDVGFPG
ncbi:hypothetical protein AVT46_gp57 [Mycobacterium phage MOOREtheMARYer]|uniref:Uncharacterized protein n=1 Tax=Mycobacterium phage MOOREtheMARYer TaxID=1647309 RepID=A0A0F6YS49_9CAUD|nr:hypothetical protein AVT46_gp57 [Mycobacterium phage MOOREtheMARYer]AKF14918.1 hypothetical protein SEA_MOORETHEMARYER_57 [Mycobacterium phage MOOREtheMARYer]